MILTIIKPLSPYANNTLECYFGHQLPDNLANEKYDSVIIYFPKAKPLMGYLLQLAAQHMAIDGLLVVIGENKGGVKSIAKLMPAYFSAPIKQDNARHCLLFTSYLTQAAPPLSLTDWLSQYTLDTPQGQLQICNLVGVFSEKDSIKALNYCCHIYPITSKVACSILAVVQES
ncbi:hypothetical protein PEC18_30680 [Paucibacter sp. O1-1]|nr:hypothetical protein [Paucibacter sp. O1-1]MDA3830075.1 hypothetical protein [Paucibacter sp. O1-1]